MSVSEKIAEHLENAGSKRESIRNAMLLLEGEWGELADNLGSTQKLLQGGFAEFEARQKELNSLRESVSESIKQLDLYLKSLDERYEGDKEREKELHEKKNMWVQELEAKGAELNEIRENYVEEVGYREEKLRDQSKVVEGLFERIELEREEIGEIKELIEFKFEEMDSKEKYLVGLKRELELFLNKILIRENEQDSRERELEGRENQLASKEKNLEEREKEVELQELELESMKMEIEFREKEADFVRQLNEKRSKDLDSREKQLDSVRAFTRDCFKEYVLKKKECKLEKAFIEKESKNLERKRGELEEKIKEIERREQELELKEKQCNDALEAQVSAEGVENLVDAGDNLSSSDIRMIVRMDGKALQIFLNETKNDIVMMSNEVFKALHFSLDPAKLVLDAMEGFYPPHLRKGDKEFETSVVRRSCIIILEQLAKMSPFIQPCVRNEAMKLASKWKEKMTTSDSLEVVGFLQLLASYDLASGFDANEAMNLLENATHLQQTTELYHLLGFPDRTAVLVQNLLKHGQYVDAVRFIYAFGHIDHFPIVTILKNYLEHVENTANALLKNEADSLKAQEEAIDQEVASIKDVIRCIRDHKLESEYSVEVLEEYVDQLLAKNANKKISASTSLHRPRKQQKLS